MVKTRTIYKPRPLRPDRARRPESGQGALCRPADAARAEAKESVRPCPRAGAEPDDRRALRGLRGETCVAAAGTGGEPMASTKYGEYVKRLSFVDEGPGSFRQGTRLTADDLGMDVNLAYGTYWTAGRIGKDAQGAHVHAFDQMMLWLGTDTGDVGALGAEVERGLGEEPEKHMITTSRAVGIPRGFPPFRGSVGGA